MVRRVKDAEELITGEKIYFKGHAKATYMSNGQTVEDAFNNIDLIVEDALNNKGSEAIKFTNIIASNWVSDSTYPSFPYRCDITCNNVTSEDYAEVIFDVAQATSGQYSPVCETGNSIVSIWATIDHSIKIPAIVITK